MKKLIFSLSILFSLNVFAHTHEGPSHKAAAFTSAEHEYLRPEAVTSGYLAVKAMEVKGFDKESLKKLQKAFEVLEKVVNSEEFKNRVVNFKNTKGERKFASNNGLTNEQIYQQFMEGRETLQPNTPDEMNFYLRLYYKRWTRVIGYTTPTTNVINVNWKFFSGFTPADVAGNLAHEWTHKIGFDHTSAAEHDSAPYAIGYIVEEMAAKLITSPSQKVAQR